MNNLRKSLRNFRPALILSIMMMLFFPYSVMAVESEYQVPENSVSYMAQANTTSQPFMAASEPALSGSDRSELEPAFTTGQTTGKVQIIPEPATENSETETLQTTEQKQDAPLFSEALSKMQQSRAHRQAEAERLGIVLPSQGGDIAAVSPSLSKIQQTLRQIMAR